MKTTLKTLGTFALVVAMAATAQADGPETGLVSGTVTDPSGTGLPGVTVTISSDRGEKMAITGGDGSYRFALLVPGDYRLHAELEGLGMADSEAVVTAGQRTEINLTLVSAAAESITVTSEAPMVDKFNVSTGATLTSDIGTEVTGENRTYYGVINFMPGVTNDDENTDLASSRPNINGATWADSTVYIDGVDTTFARYGGSRVFLPSSATTEVSLESGALSADYGRTVGSATNVIVKSGTNEFHGDAVYSRTEEDWNAEFDDHPELEQRQTSPRPADFFRRTEQEKANSDDQYELGLGGPIQKDKIWFFVSANKISSNRTGKTVNGDAVDESGTTESRIAKFNFQPSQRHSIAASWIDTPVFRNFVLEPVFDRYAVTPFDISGELYTVSYNNSISSSLFLEAKFADQTSNEDKLLAVGGFDAAEATRIKQQDERFPPNPLAGPDWPGNNFSPYLDIDGWHNGWLLDNGYGTNEFPRTQLNAALTQFVGSEHELKYGVDFQQVEWIGDVRRENLYSGQGNNLFSATSASGFENPFSLNPLGAACDFTTGESCILQDYNHPDLLADLGSNDTESRNLSAYVRDRFTVGDKWTFNVGLRLESQSHENDIGREVMDSTDLSPRVSVAYDLSGDGSQLLTAYVGRTYNQLPQQVINEYLQDQFNGYNGYERRLFLDCAFVACVPGAPGLRFPMPLGYTQSLGFIRPGGQWDLVDAGVFQSDIEAYYKDEVVLGYEHQLSKNWALDAKGIWWEVDNLVSSTNQLAEIDGRLDLFVLTANTGDIPGILTSIREAASPGQRDRLAQAEALAAYTEPSRDYKALQLQLNRRFDGSWALYSNLTWGEAGGSSHGDVFNNTNDTYGEQLEQVLTETDILNCQALQAGRTVPVDCVGSLTPFLGQPLSIINRDGRADFDRTVILKSTGWKVWNLTPRQSFTLGANYNFQTGKPWARTESLGGSNITLGDGIPESTAVTVPIEPTGSREIGSHWWINLSGAYGFPIAGERVSGELRLEIQNLTDNQEQIGVTGRGEVRPIRRGFQRPQRIRLLGSVRF